MANEFGARLVWINRYRNAKSTYVRLSLVRSTGQCNTACSLSAGVWKPKVFRGR